MREMKTSDLEISYCRNEEWMQSVFLIIKTAYIKTLAD
jgi:hypothetical protein